jgi:hypothetical protein
MKVCFSKIADEQLLEQVKIPGNAVKISDDSYNVIEDSLITLYTKRNDDVVKIERYPVELFTSNNSLRILKLKDKEKIENIIIFNYLIQVEYIEESNLYQLLVYESNNGNRSFTIKFTMCVNKDVYSLLVNDVRNYYTNKR